MTVQQASEVAACGGVVVGSSEAGVGASVCWSTTATRCSVTILPVRQPEEGVAGILEREGTGVPVQRTADRDAGTGVEGRP